MKKELVRGGGHAKKKVAAENKRGDTQGERNRRNRPKRFGAGRGCCEEGTSK